MILHGKACNCTCNCTEPLKIKVKKLREDAVLPTKAHPSDVGFDLCLPYCVTNYIGTVIPPGQTLIVGLGIAIEPPEGYYCEIVPRSHLAKTMLRIPNSFGVIDPNYRGELKIPLWNAGNEEIELRDYPRPAQLILRRLPEAEIEEVTELSETDRGQCGFGSTNSSAVRASWEKPVQKDN